SFTFDLQFGLYPEGLAVDIGGDGDIDWSMMDPAFGAFGRQRMFYLTTTMDGISRGSLLRNITVASGGATAGQGIGGHFILPAGAVIDESVIGVLANEVGNFSLWLATKTSAGPVVEEHIIDYRYEWGPSHPSLDTHMSGFSQALLNLSTHPDVAASRVDDNGDTWNEYYFVIRNATGAQAGSTEVQFGEMSIRYYWTAAITDDRSNLIRELNQGASITPPSNQNTEIPLMVYTRTAGGATFDDLTVVTVSGLDSIWGFRSFNTGLYPTGEVYSQETTHLSAVADSSISGARLVFESETGDAAIKYDVQTNTFTEEDPLDIIILDGTSSATSFGASQLNVKWKFRVNTNWEDTAVVQFYGSTIVDTNLGARYEGKPVGYTFDPDSGNAVENDAYFSQFEIHNTAGVQQTDFTEVRTTPELTLTGQVRLENLDISPDPKLYNLSLERYVPSDSSYIVADVCMPDVPTSACTVTHGNFSWNLTLASSEEAVYRLRIDDYSGGDLLDVPVEIKPDPQLLPQDNSSVYFKVNVSNIQSSPSITDLSYRFGTAGTGFYWPFLPLGGSTWLSPNREGAGTPQVINATVRDIKQTLAAVTMHYWLSGIDDDNQDGLAQEAEYTEVLMTRQSPVSDTIKHFHAELDDRPSDPGGTTVISVYFTGVDEFGNLLASEADIVENAGGPGVTNDLLTYKAMNAARPSAESFSLFDVYGNQMLDDPATLFAGNTYRLCVDGSDPNGWVDIKTIEMDLMNTSTGDQPLSMADFKIVYDPENVTFSRPDAGDVSVYDPDKYSVDGIDTSILELVSPMNITRPDGVAYLQDPFEESFRACVSIQLSWNIPGNIVNKSTEFKPVVSVVDRFGFSSVKSKGIQSFMYSDGLVLTDLQIIEYNDVDEI
ncbi:MAG TPA: hypothetical protein QF646_05285, partial [Candidatus Poseidoniales archaeon]|nr:hypothetical protein [Candidatus Poseidoniales archaeon]